MIRKDALFYPPVCSVCGLAILCLGNCAAKSVNFANFDSASLRTSYNDLIGWHPYEVFETSGVLDRGSMFIINSVPS